MYWYKVKNLLIVMFIIINLFLISFIVQGHVFRQKAEYDKMEALNSALNANNISVADGIISSETSTLKTTTAENIIPHEKNLPETFFKGNYETVQEDDITKYKQGSKTVYTQNGKLYFSDSNLKPDTALSEKNISDAVKILSGYGFNISSAQPKISGNTINFIYKFNDLPLFENNLSVKMSGERIASLSGYFIKINNEYSDEIRIKSTADILIDFIQDEKRTDKVRKVTSISLGYSLLLADSSVDFKHTETIPTYKITTDNNETYFYDASR